MPLLGPLRRRNSSLGRRLAAAAIFFAAALSPAIAAAADPAAVAQPPVWAEKGVFVYRVSTPDAGDVLEQAKEALELTSHLLDDSVPQITILGGLVGHDHGGAANWDGLWPDWNRVTYRAGGDWNKLAEFMLHARDRANARISFHVNLTDVNAGLADYSESRDFFQQLVRSESIYRRDFDRQAGRRAGTPYVPTDIAECLARDGRKTPDPIAIIALVNYQKFWNSGLAGKMIDTFYGHLPYPPPLLYLDVLNLTGGNFSTGPPDGPLGGSEQTQLEGVVAIVDHLRSKGTDLATEGDRPYGNHPDGSPRAGYVWYHGRGFSNDDYRVISGGSGVNLAGHHVLGNPGAFNISPIALTSAGLAAVRAHYEALLAGRPTTKKMPGLETWHLAYRSSAKLDEFDIPGTGDAFRGDWADLVNYFYLAAIQENFHIGNRAVRRQSDGFGAIHVATYRLANPDGSLATILIPDFLTDWRKAPAQKAGETMLTFPIETKVRVATGGKYPLTIRVQNHGNRADRNFNVYVNGRLHRNVVVLRQQKGGGDWITADAGQAELVEGENTIAFDAGILQASWSDGTVAEWTTPYLRSGFKATRGDVTFADDYDRMWPDSWSGQKKIYFFSWDGTTRAWKLPEEWRSLNTVTVYPLTVAGRGPAATVPVREGSVSPQLLPQVPYVAVP